MMLRHQLATAAFRVIEQVGGGVPSLPLAVRLACRGDAALAARLSRFMLELAPDALEHNARGGEPSEIAQARAPKSPRGAPSTWPRFREILLRELGRPATWDPSAPPELPNMPTRQLALVLAWRVHVAISSAPVADHGPLFDRLAVR